MIISQHGSDHCSEQTLKHISPTAKTIILAEPSAAKVIRGWGHFHPQSVMALKRLGGLHAGSMTDQSSVTRIPVPPVVRGGEAGEVTVAHIPQRRDLTRLHAAIGVTYRPPPVAKQTRPPSSQKKKTKTSSSHTSHDGLLPLPIISCGLATPPAVPRSHKSYSNLPTVFTAPPQPPGGPEGLPAPAPPPALPLRAARSTSTLTPASTNAPLTTSSLSHVSAQRTLSVVFSPHGIAFEGNLASYATSHLVREAALPLTALLYGSDSVGSPWWLRGNVLLGEPAGREVAVRLGAVCLIPCHDRYKSTRSSARSWLRAIRKRQRREVEGALASEAKGESCDGEGGREGAEGRLSRTATITKSPEIVRCCSKEAGQCRNGVCKETQVIVLGSGEEVILTSEGVWNVSRRHQQAQVIPTGSAGVAASP